MLAPCCLPAMVCADICLGGVVSSVSPLSLALLSPPPLLLAAGFSRHWSLGAATPRVTWEVPFFDCLCAQSVPEARTCSGVTQPPQTPDCTSLSLSLPHAALMLLQASLWVFCLCTLTCAMRRDYAHSARESSSQIMGSLARSDGAFPTTNPARTSHVNSPSQPTMGSRPFHSLNCGLPIV